MKRVGAHVSASGGVENAPLIDNQEFNDEKQRSQLHSNQLDSMGVTRIRKEL
jgi:hypothetical protein